MVEAAGRLAGNALRAHAPVPFVRIDRLAGLTRFLTIATRWLTGKPSLSPGGAAVSSQGRQPLDLWESCTFAGVFGPRVGRAVRPARRGVRSCADQVREVTPGRSQGLAPLATHCRPSGG